MTEQELQQLRREKWRVAGNPARTLEDAREFLAANGFALMYPLRKQEQRVPVLAPTFVGAYIGDDAKLPTWQQAFADPRALEATELMVRLLRERSAFELKFGETSFVTSATAFPYFYGLVGDRAPRQMPKPGTRSEYSPLARDLLEKMNDTGPMTKRQLAEQLGGSLSSAALDRALNELWSRLRLTRVDYTPEEGAKWELLFRWAPQAVRAGVNVGVGAALSALVSKYLDCVVAAEQTEIEEFFGNFVGRSRVREAVNALLSAREFQFVHIGGRAMIQVTPPRVAPPPRAPRLAPPARARTLRERARDAQRTTAASPKQDTPSEE